MKIVIQCAGQKRKRTKRMRSPSGEELLFVARPELLVRDSGSSVRYCRPGDPVGPGLGTWRDALGSYNRASENPYDLSSAADLYRPRVYRELVDAFGWENVFILSAGWGLIRSDFLTPDYNITFSNQKRVPPWARRAKRLTLPLEDLNHLAEAMTSPDEPVHFFGGRDYLPMFHALTRNVAAKLIVHHKGSPPLYEGFSYELFSCDRNQNWHYGAAEAFIMSKQTK
jgi:hypothetical protein